MEEVVRQITVPQTYRLALRHWPLYGQEDTQVLEIEIADCVMFVQAPTLLEASDLVISRVRSEFPPGMAGPVVREIVTWAATRIAGAPLIRTAVQDP